jgi:methylated-DNA-[protein]-cysteine S-methyltransferase
MTYALDHAIIATAIGTVRILGNADFVTRIHIEGRQPQVTAAAAAIREAERQIRAYFDGTLRIFDLPLVPPTSDRGAALRTGIEAVDYGETLSYGALARALNSGPRAIGQACARNPYPLVIPCHRVLASGGRLGAYSAGEGPRSKAWLLTHESRIAGKDIAWAA